MISKLKCLIWHTDTGSLKCVKNTKMDTDKYRRTQRHMHTASHINVSITIFGFVSWDKDIPSIQITSKQSGP